MDYKKSIRTSFKTGLIIIKLIIPIYILADILFYYNTLSYIAFIFEPITSVLGLPVETSLAIISGMFLNLYAAIAFAAPLDLTPQEWTILAIYLGICHSLVVEGAITKKLGFSHLYSNTVRIGGGLIVGYLATFLPASLYTQEIISQKISQEAFSNIFDLLRNSIANASILTVKIILIITALIFLMDFIKNLSVIKESKKNVSKGFSLAVGTVLGLTYGAGVLIEEAKSKSMSKNDLFFVVTFLLICHAIIEDTLLFAIFGANVTIIITVRTIAAIVIAWLLLKLYERRNTKKTLTSEESQ